MDIESLVKVNLIDAAGLHDAPSEVQKIFLQRASQMVSDRAFDRIERTLPEEKRSEFYRLCEENNTTRTDVFLEENVPTLKEIVGEEILIVKKALLEAINSQKD